MPQKPYYESKLKENLNAKKNGLNSKIIKNTEKLKSQFYPGDGDPYG